MTPAAARVAGGVLLVVLATGAAALDADDRYVAGYAAAVVERELGLRAELEVRDGVVHAAVSDLSASERAGLVAALETVPGVRGVVLDPDGAAAAAGAGDPAAAGSGLVLLPERELFDPLLADPRWPHFSASALAYLGDDELDGVAATNFGETIPLLAADGPWGSRVGLDLHAGVFSIFDLASDSFDLVNSDFLVGLAGVARRGDFSAILRLHHQSSHLGDELLLRERVDRVNLSYEAVELLLSWDASETLRLYGGGGWLLRTDPEDLEEGLLQLGGEWMGARGWLGGALRPLLALDLQSRQETDWDVDLSARAGFQLEGRRFLGSRVQLLLEFYDGRSPNGQFFERDITYLGGGAHLYF